MAGIPMANRVISGAVSGHYQTDTATLIVMKLVLEIVEDTEYQESVETVINKRTVASDIDSSANKDLIYVVVKKLRLLVEAFQESQLPSLLEQCDRLNVTHANARTRYNLTVQQLFHDGVTWGRVVLFCAFSVGYLVHVVRRDMAHLSDSVIKWTVGVFKSKLDPWIEQSGGWENFSAFADRVLAGSEGEQGSGLGGRLLAAAAVLGIAALAGLIVGRGGGGGH
uniref:Bcl-2-like protein n=1 Tax=Halisarca dujardinii TaxID=2583056 RepID=A0A6C0PP00_HALDU|nr:Bcl-2-like protein [Halisarca dujardinii]QIZ30870.1 Bcl-2-like protein [Halisarca dujardinii]